MKPLAWLFALLTLGGTALFYLLAPPVERDTATDGPLVAPQEQQGKLPSQSLLGKNRRLKSDQTKMLEERIKEINRPVREKDAQVVEKITPEIQQRMVDGALSFRKPQYLHLFASWGVDSKTAEDILKMIQERESQLTELRMRFMREGPAYRREFEKQRKIVDENAERQLSQRLGRKRFDELCQMENSWNPPRPMGGQLAK